MHPAWLLFACYFSTIPECPTSHQLITQAVVVAVVFVGEAQFSTGCPKYLNHDQSLEHVWMRDAFFSSWMIFCEKVSYPPTTNRNRWWLEEPCYLLTFPLPTLWSIRVPKESSFEDRGIQYSVGHWSRGCSRQQPWQWTRSYYQKATGLSYSNCYKPPKFWFVVWLFKALFVLTNPDLLIPIAADLLEGKKCPVARPEEAWAPFQGLPGTLRRSLWPVFSSLSASGWS